MRRPLLTLSVLVCVTAFTAWAMHDAQSQPTLPIGVAAPQTASPPAPPGRVLRQEEFWTVNNQPLDRPLRLVALRQPATAVFADGSTVEVQGIRLIAPLDLSVVARLAHVDDENVEVEVLDRSSPASRMDVKFGGVAVCGHTRGAVPRYSRRDLGTLLVTHGVALPTIALLEDEPGRAGTLFEALQTGIITSNLHEPLSLAGDTEAAELGRRLAKGHPKLKLAAAWLLAQSRDPQAVATATARAEDLLSQGVVGDGHDVGQRQVELRVWRDLLYQLGDRKGLAALTRKQFDAYGMDSPHEQALLAVSLVSLGDWGALDESVRRITDPGVPDAYADPLALHLADRLDFPLARGEDRRSFARWYAAVRPRLTWDRAWRFGLGPDTHDQYRASMQPYLPGAQKPAAE